MSLCRKCSKSVNRTGQEKISCAACNSYFHLACVNLRKADIDNFPPNNLWKCESCVNARRLNRSLSDDVPVIDQQVGSRTVLTPELLEKMLSTLRSDILGAQKDSEVELRKTIELCNSKIDDLNKTCQEQLSLINRQQEAIDQLKVENMALKKSVEVLELRAIDQEQYGRRNTLEIQGIPFATNEDAGGLVLKVSEALGVKLDSNDIDVCHRLKSVPNKVPGIIVKFVRRSVANDLMAAKKSKRRLSARQLGFDSDLLVYLNRSLCRERKSLFYEARNQLREGRLAGVWVDHSGRINVKCVPNDHPRVIVTTAQLKNLIAGK